MVLSAIFVAQWGWLWPILIVSAGLSLIGLIDLWQGQHAVLRNYPILGHIRYLLEEIRPEIRQYLLEADNDALPFSRSQRYLVHARAKEQVSDKPFGTLLDVSDNGYEFIGHQTRPAPYTDHGHFRTVKRYQTSSLEGKQ